jgi:hypothetical protein
LASTYKTTQHQNPEDSNEHLHCHGNLNVRPMGRRDVVPNPWKCGLVAQEFIAEIFSEERAKTDFYYL